MLMNENSELRSFVSCSKNFSKNIINKSIKNNIVPINNDGGVTSKRMHRGFIPSTFAFTLTYIKFYIYIFSLTTTYILFCILMYILSLILFIIIIYILFFITIYISFNFYNLILFYILLISLYFICFINLIISSILISNTIKNASLIKTSVIIIY